MVGSKRLIKHVDSWFSPKCLLGQRQEMHRGGRALNGSGGLPAYPFQSNSEYRDCYPGSESMGDKLHGRDRNNGDRRLRSPSMTKCLRKCGCKDSGDVGLEAAII